MTIQVMNQIPRQKRQLLDVVIFAPLVMVVLTYLLPSNVFLSLISMFLICTYPGFAVINRYKLHRSNRFQDLFLSVLLSLLLLQSVYASYSVLCYGLGFEQSITNTQVFILAIVILLFSAFSLRKNMDELMGYELIFKISQRLNGRIFLIYLIPLALPLISLIAVVRLNVLNDSITTGIFLYSCIAILLILIFGSVLRRSTGMHYLVFYCTVLALLFGSTFRGDGGFWGWDINQEFAIATRVSIQQHWIPLSESPYNAMLSISVLPVVLSILTKFSLPIIFKLFYPLIAALLPIASYSLLRRFVGNSTAMSVVIIQIVASITFIPQLTALSRQVIGLAFFAGIILVLFDPTWDRKKKTIVILALTCGLSFSHYTSAYLYSAIFLISGLFSILVRKTNFFRRERLQPVATLSLGLSILVITFLWNGLLNNSAQDVNQVVKNIYVKGPQFLPNNTQSFIDRWLSGVETTSTELSPAEFKVEFLKNSAYNYPNFQIEPASLTYNIKPSEYPFTEPILGTGYANLFYWLYIVANSTFQGMVVIQILSMIKLITGYFPKKNTNSIKRSEISSDTTLLDIFTLTSVSFSIAVYLRIAGSTSALYGPERVAFQLAFIFSLPIAILIDRFMRSSRLTHRIGLFALLLSSFIFLQQATGLIGYTYGKISSRISSSLSEDRPFVISQSEGSAAHWIQKNIATNSTLQSDITANLVNLQMNIFETKVFIAQTAPFGIFSGSYVYLSKANLETGITRQGYGGLKNMQVPFDYLNQYLSVVYSSEGARVYR
jgi:uncharacterized membrane protein